MLVPPPFSVESGLVHADIPPAKVARRNSIPSIIRQRRRRAGTPKRRMQARVAPPPAYQGTPGRLGWTRAALVAAVVEIVRVAVSAATPVILTGVVEPKLNMGRCAAPDGLLEIAADSATLPVKPPLGITVIVEVLPVVAPDGTVTDVPAIVKLAGTAATTVSLKVFDVLVENSCDP